jgi:hypothetical protein
MILLQQMFSRHLLNLQVFGVVYAGLDGSSQTTVDCNLCQNFMMLLLITDPPTTTRRRHIRQTPSKPFTDKAEPGSYHTTISIDKRHWDTDTS